jgi:hypothetical protein
MAVVLIVLWVLGLLTHVAGGLIHLLLVIAIIVIVVNLVRRGRSGRRIELRASGAIQISRWNVWRFEKRLRSRRGRRSKLSRLGKLAVSSRRVETRTNSTRGRLLGGRRAGGVPTDLLKGRHFGRDASLSPYASSQGSQHPLSFQSSYSEATAIVLEGYGRSSASRARMNARSWSPRLWRI